MSVIKRIIDKGGRDWDSFNKYLFIYGFHNEEHYNRYTEVIENNRLSKNKLNKNSSIVYQENFNTLLNFLPAELVEKILAYETYSSPMVNVYKEMIMRSGLPINLNIDASSRYLCRTDVSLEKNYLNMKIINYKFKEIWTDCFIYCWNNIYNITELKLNSPYFIKQFDTEKNIDRLLLYLIKIYNTHEKKYDNEYENYESFGLTPQDILMDIKKSIGLDWNFISNLIYNVFLNIAIKSKYRFHTEWTIKYEEERRFKKDKFGRYLDLNGMDKLYFKYVDIRYELNLMDYNKGDVMEYIQNDFNRNKIPIKIMKSWKKDKMIRIWVQEGREIFLKQHNKKYKEVLKEYIGKIIHKFVNITSEEEKQRFHRQTRIGECAGCISICEECERLLF